MYIEIICHWRIVQHVWLNSAEFEYQFKTKKHSPFCHLADLVNKDVFFPLNVEVFTLRKPEHSLNCWSYLCWILFLSQVWLVRKALSHHQNHLFTMNISNSFCSLISQCWLKNIFRKTTIVGNLSRERAQTPQETSPICIRPRQSSRMDKYIW